MSEFEGKDQRPHNGNAPERSSSDVATDERVSDLEARLIEQEHRTAHVALNAYKYFGDEKNKARKTAAMKALFWRVFAPYTAAAVFASTGSLIGGLSAYFLYQQNEKLAAQTTLLEKQVMIQAGEGRWENLWNIHYNPQESRKIESAELLVQEGITLTGVNLRGEQAPNRELHHELRPRLWEQQVADNWVRLTELSSYLVLGIESGEFDSLKFTIERDRSESRFFIQNSEVTLAQESHLANCHFVDSHLIQGMGQSTLSRCMLDWVAISPNDYGNLTITSSAIRSAYAGNPSGRIRDPRNEPITNDVHYERTNPRVILEFSAAKEFGIFGGTTFRLRESKIESLRVSANFRGLVFASVYVSREAALEAILDAQDIGPQSCVQEIVVIDGETQQHRHDTGDLQLNRLAEEWLKNKKLKCRGEGRMPQCGMSWIGSCQIVENRAVASFSSDERGQAAKEWLSEVTTGNPSASDNNADLARSLAKHESDDDQRVASHF